MHFHNEICPITVWLTGLPSSGKTTLGTGLKQFFFTTNINVILLDGDEVRKSICSDLGFSENDRSENIRRVAAIAKLMNDQGFVVICCFVSPLISIREMAKQIIGEDRFCEVFVDAKVETCNKRDVKGLYKKANSGIIKDLTGVSAPYENPVSPTIHINTDALNIDQSLQLLYKGVLNFVSKLNH